MIHCQLASVIQARPNIGNSPKHPKTQQVVTLPIFYAFVTPKFGQLSLATKHPALVNLPGLRQLESLFLRSPGLAKAKALPR